MADPKPKYRVQLTEKQYYYCRADAHAAAVVITKELEIKSFFFVYQFARRSCDLNSRDLLLDKIKKRPSYLG